MSEWQVKPLGERSSKLQRELERCDQAIQQVWGVTAFEAIPKSCRPPTEDHLSSRLVRGLRRLVSLQEDLSIARNEMLATRNKRLEINGRDGFESLWLKSRDVESIITQYERQGKVINTVSPAYQQIRVAHINDAPKYKYITMPEEDNVKAAKRVPRFPGLEGPDTEINVQSRVPASSLERPTNVRTTFDGDRHDVPSPVQAAPLPPPPKFQKLRLTHRAGSFEATKEQKRSLSQADMTESAASPRHFQKKHRPKEATDRSFTVNYGTRSKDGTTSKPIHDRSNSPPRILQRELAEITDFDKIHWPARVQHPTQCGTWYLVNSADELLPYVKAALHKRILRLENQLSGSHTSFTIVRQPQDGNEEPPDPESEAAIEVIRPTKVAGLLDEMEEVWARKMVFVHDALLSHRRDVEDDQMQVLQSSLSTFKSDLLVARQKFEHDCCAVGLLWTINGLKNAEQKEPGLGSDKRSDGPARAAGGVDTAVGGNVGAADVETMSATGVEDVSTTNATDVGIAVAKDSSNANLGHSRSASVREEIDPNSEPVIDPSSKGDKTSVRGPGGLEIIDLCSSDDDVA